MRLENWDSKIFAYLEAVGPFKWGSNDCCAFVSNAIEVITGENVLAGLQNYKTAFGAKKFLKKHDGIENLWTKILGESIGHKLLKRGDVVLYSNKGEPLVGLCVGSRFVALTEKGIVYLPMSLAEKGWKV